MYARSRNLNESRARTTVTES